jgi:protein phosphatase
MPIDINSPRNQPNLLGLRIESAAVTTVGQVRPLNEDAVFHQTNKLETGQEVGLFLVCDGVGGYRGGEVASQLTVETITDELAKVFPWVRQAFETRARTYPNADTLRYWIESTIEKANEATRRYAEENPDIKRAGTTLVMALIYQGIAHIANIGDSRVYFWRNGELTQITKDHSLVAAMVEEGVLDEAQALKHPRRNIISRAIGSREQVEADFFEWVLRPGDKMLLCSDGLWVAFTEKSELAKIVGLNLSPHEICARLVNEANRRDGSDNISAVVVFIKSK